MRQNSSSLPLIPLFFLALSLPPLKAAGEDSQVKTEIDWLRGLVSLEITAPLPLSSAPLPVAKFRLKQELEGRFPLMFKSAIGFIPVDSRRNLTETLLEEPALLATLTRIGEGLTPSRIYLTEDMKSLNLSYQFALFPDLIQPLLPRKPPEILPPQLGYEPSAPFTGIVIYAGDPLPVHGERDARGRGLEGVIVPCLLPRLYDEEMNLVFSADNMNPSYRESWGIIQYTPSLNANVSSDRIGDYPYYTMAVGLYGVTNTDIILSTEATRKLLSRGDTRNLLQEGRITVITPGDS